MLGAGLRVFPNEPVFRSENNRQILRARLTNVCEYRLCKPMGYCP